MQKKLLAVQKKLLAVRANFVSLLSMVLMQKKP